MYRKSLLCYLGIHKKSKFVSEMRDGVEYAVCEHCGGCAVGHIAAVVVPCAGDERARGIAARIVSEVEADDAGIRKP